MKALRYIVATIAALLIWPIVAVGVGMLLAVIIPPREGEFFLGVWLDWHALPGALIGLAVGIHVFRRLIKPWRTQQHRDDRAA
jgi:membrane protein DedA with SNARE-associated domain